MRQNSQPITYQPRRLCQPGQISPGFSLIWLSYSVLGLGKWVLYSGWLSSAHTIKFKPSFKDRVQSPAADRLGSRSLRLWCLVPRGPKGEMVGDTPSKNPIRLLSSNTSCGRAWRGRPLKLKGWVSNGWSDAMARICPLLKGGNQTVQTSLFHLFGHRLWVGAGKFGLGTQTDNWPLLVAEH